ncbi:MAG TPA: type II CAAX endopeptidase family protein [Candidatus Acidoferrales bacterium]|nr:type II CAAX endopeptidase family protein [Candidatus Acidoferrales bacterium]
MTENEQSLQPADLQPASAPPAPEPAGYNIFYGPNGVRAGWRLLIASAIFYAIVVAINFVFRHARGASTQRVFLTFSARGVLIGEAITFGSYLFASWIMSRIEARRMRDYGLGLARAFGGQFWLSALAGFAAISLLLGALKIAGVFQLGQPALHGPLAWEDAGLWGLAFLFVGFSEEGTSRGYILFTLVTGIGFWPAAIATSIAFGMLHWGNTGESYVGMMTAGGIGFFFCILLRKTGTLWPAIGFHAAWDWGETYFYGVPDSGLGAPGHLFSARFAGPVWLTGGTVGPEGSWFCVVLVLVLCIAAAFLPGARFPNPDAIPDPRRRRAQPTPTLFAEGPNRLSQDAT